MSESKHTPGPWRAQKPLRQGLVVDRKWEIVAPLEGGEMVIVGEHTGVDCLREANARLIAAAPEMLEALREIHKRWCCPEPSRLKDWSARCDVMADYARAAIAKAEGQ